VVAVADHQPVTRPVDLVSERLDICGNLGLQRRGQHLPGTIADQLVEQRPAHRGRGVLVRLVLPMDYLEHGRTFPNQRANAGPDQSYRTSDHPREGALLRVTRPRTTHRF
jgi:hypothetical protein